MGAVQSPPEGYELLVPTNPYWKQFGPVYANRARHRLAFEVGEHHCNPIRTLHGGALATFADMQLLARPECTDAPGTHAPTISLDIEYLTTAVCGDWVEAEVSLDRVTRRLIFSRAMISVDTKLIARANIIYRNHDKTGYPLT
jgi:acyl-coenzyme A thioesterase PaaI-like protein